MSKPKYMTEEEAKAWKEKERKYRSEYRKANRAKENARLKRWYEKNPLKKPSCAEYSKKWRIKNPDKVKKRIQTRIISMDERKKRKDYERQRRCDLSDCYVAYRLKLPTAILLRHTELLEAKREQIRTKRTLKQYEQES